MENNQAFVARLGNIQKIEGADKIVQADVLLNGVKITQVVVGTDTVENTKVVYFDSNLCINPAVIEDIDKASPGYGKEGFSSLGNYLGKNGRVRVVKLRGIISNGLAVDFGKFIRYNANLDEFEDGFSFTELGGVEICHKYTAPVKAPSQGKQGKTVKAKTRIIPEQFHFHIDTDQLPRNIHRIKPDQIISISRKIHGTSAIFGRNLVLRKLSLWEKAAKFLGAKIDDKEYGDIVASRTVVKSIDTGDQTDVAKNAGFYKVDVWTEAGNKYFKGKLHDGETVYFEIVGYLPGAQSMIQKGYDYGAKEGEYKIAVYRITLTALDGHVYEYGWQQTKARCAELEVPMVEEFFYGKAFDLMGTGTGLFKDLSNEETVKDWRQSLLAYLKNTYLEKDCLDCKKKVPDEGIVLRVEGLGIEVFKYKSEKFLLGESKAAEEGEVSVEDEQA